MEKAICESSVQNQSVIASSRFSMSSTIEEALSLKPANQTR